MANEDNKFDQFTGKAKEAAGKVSGDKDLEAEGKVQGAEGKAKEFVDDAKAGAKAVKDRVDEEIDKRRN
ncbi:CsbD family protein [Ancrocorticia populi]|uniref:CsbD family protein n=1 Tax=Ancrocorticia populi TaxID=2175228 RepID=UPI003F93C098